MTDNSLSELDMNNVQIHDGSGLNNNQNSSGIMVSVIEFYNKNKFIIYSVLSLIYLLFFIIMGIFVFV
jgi:hypothetical protein